MKWIERLALWVSIPFFFLLWQVASMSGLVNELLFPPPTKVAAALWTELINGTLLLDLGMSGCESSSASPAGPRWPSLSDC